MFMPRPTSSGPNGANPTDEVPRGLVYTSDATPGISRQRRGKGFAYRRDDGSLVREHDELQRIRSLAIPPAYREVWICPTPNGHLQATGRDARGRKQYRYHAVFRRERDANKFDRMLAFAQALPRIRRRVARDLADAAPGREVLLATIVKLLDTTLARVGNDEYARENGSYGLTTLCGRHVRVRGSQLELMFKGKSGVAQHLAVKDARVARVVRRCLGAPGEVLFRYSDEQGRERSVGSTEVNDYLQSIAGGHFSAKDFRTWHASVLALQVTMQAMSRAQPGFTLKQMLLTVSQALGNTPAVCKKSYVHPQVLEFAALVCADPPAAADRLQRCEVTARPASATGLRRAERQLLAYLREMPGTEDPMVQLRKAASQAARASAARKRQT
jgi:DNA topoisomerase I